MAKTRSEFVVLAIDIGTSSSRAALFDNRGRRLPDTLASSSYHVTYGDDGKAELDPAELLRAVRRTCDRVSRQYRSLAKSKRSPIRAISASSFWHGLLGLDKKLRPITPVFTWADSRAAADARKLREHFDERTVQLRTGCMLRSTFWPAKLRWLKRIQPALFRRVAYWVSPSDWIFYELSGELRCSASMASGTGLFNFLEQDWDRGLLKSCGLTGAVLPRMGGCVEPQRGSSFSQFGAVLCPIGDGAAGNLGSGADRALVAAINLGTSGAVRVIQNANRDALRRLPAGLFCYVVDSDRWIVGGAISNAGNLREWCLRELRIDDESGRTERVLSREAAATDSLTILPFWVEERAPTWPEGKHGVIAGLDHATTAGQILRAATTASFYRLAQILEILESSFGRTKRIIVSGGVLKSPASVKILADALGRDVQISATLEASLRGAAVHALNQLGIKVKTRNPARSVKHNRALSRLHRQSRDRQRALERQLPLSA